MRCDAGASRLTMAKRPTSNIPRYKRQRKRSLVGRIVWGIVRA